MYRETDKESFEVRLRVVGEGMGDSAVATESIRGLGTVERQGTDQDGIELFTERVRSVLAQGGD